MTDRLILAIDSGTTSTRALAVTLDGRVVASHARPLAQGFPEPGWVEHDAAEIRDATRACIDAVAAEVGADAIAAAGLANQRETAVLWDAGTGAPIGPAIVWQDRRTAPACAALRAAGHEARVQRGTGLLLDPYFTATKLRWALDARPEARAAADAGRLRVGTIDAWLLASLAGAHVTDATNASRTLLMDLGARAWSAELAALFGVPLAALPRIVPNAGPIATLRVGGRDVPVTGVAGDQQAAAIGQACLAVGDVKCTYGTGIFMLANAGAQVPVSRHRLLATLLADVGGAATYALEGSIFVGGDAVKWLRDGVGLLDTAAQSEALARSVPDNGGVTFVPAFAGLGAPHWEPLARGLLTGITGGTTRAHIVRATLEAMSQQTADLLDAFAADGVTPATLRVDGGMVANDWLCQDLADATGLMVARPRVIETTAVGAAVLAAVGAGLHASLAEACAAMVAPDRTFAPASAPDARAARRDAWRRAIRQTMTL